MTKTSRGHRQKKTVNRLFRKYMDTYPSARSGYCTRIAVGCVAMLCLVGCQEPDYDTLFDQAEARVLEQEWDEASALLKKILLANPDHSGAHYYLGRCYLNATDFRPHLAEGEFQTAVHIFRRTDRKSPIERFDDDYFEFICHISSAKVVLSAIQRLVEDGVPLIQLRGLLDQAREYADTAETVIPDAREVRDLNALIDAIEAMSSGRPWHPRELRVEPTGPVSI